MEIKTPYPPMEATSVAEIPTGTTWVYEPKWDGFRCLAFRDWNKLQLQSKSGQDLTRYFPEVAQSLLDLPAQQFVLDGEIVVPVKGEFLFDQLLQRIHPAQSRVQKLAAEFPALLIVFDLLVDDHGRSLTEQPWHQRRALLEKFSNRFLKRSSAIKLSPTSADLKTAKKWFGAIGSKVDGIIAKRVDANYRSGERDGMQKIKAIRSADCVVGGFRYAEKQPVVGSLLLGLYDGAGLLHHVGFCSGLKADVRKALTPKLKALIKPPGFTGRAPGGPSRWSNARSAEWQPLAPTLVVEVGFDQVTAERFRHGTRFLRWRPDKAPEQCTLTQLKAKRSSALDLFED